MGRSHGEEGGDDSKRMHFEGCIEQKGITKGCVAETEPPGLT